MNGLVRERNWYGGFLPGIKAGYLRLFGLEGGRVKSRKAVIVLSLACGASAFLFRQYKIQIIPPWVFFDPVAIFLYFPALSCPWIATIPALAGGVAAGGNKLASVIALGIAVQLVYFSSRFLESRGLGKYRFLAIPFGSFLGTFIGAACFDVMGLLSLEVVAPIYFVRSIISVSLCAATVPSIWRWLRKKHLL